jgi:EAL and modified HD-GYP domain-containing signal transduction protein
MDNVIGPRRRGPADAAMNVADCALVARQPIYGAAMNVTAYELLYAGPPTGSMPEAMDARTATLRVVADAALEIGLDRLAGGLPVHINYPRELLTGSTTLTVQPERVVIEVVENIPSDPQLIEGIIALRKRGHHVALDDYAPRLNDPALLDIVDIVKIDVSTQEPLELERTVPELIKRGLRVIAEEVATVEQFEHCLELGFEAFQGDFLKEPQTVLAQRTPSNRLAVLRLLAELQREQRSLAETERLVSQDMSLSYRVLRSINSSYYALPRKIDSIRQAIVILGEESLRQLCTLAALQGLDNRPPSLYVTAMARARLCEQLAQLAGVAETGPYFITGLFSLLDVLTGTPMSQVVDELPLATGVKLALLAEGGDLGAALKCARAYERASWHRVAYGNLPPELIRTAYVESVFWAERTQSLMAPPAAA